MAHLVKNETEYVKKLWFPKCNPDDGETGWLANVKWDGCVDLWNYNLGIPEDPDYIHICSIDDLVDMLGEIKREQEGFVR